MVEIKKLLFKKIEIQFFYDSRTKIDYEYINTTKQKQQAYCVC